MAETSDSLKSEIARQVWRTEVEGYVWRTAENWIGIIPQNIDKPIKYLEVGTLVGANLISVAKLFASHPESVLVCIDPWEEYPEYTEAYTQQANFEMFSRNIARHNVDKQTQVLRTYSHLALPSLTDNFFDIIYIDGNHLPEYVLEDAVLSFRKLKVGGYLIFDDYESHTQRGIDAFVSAYRDRLNVINMNHRTQAFMQKIK